MKGFNHLSEVIIHLCMYPYGHSLQCSDECMPSLRACNASQAVHLLCAGQATGELLPYAECDGAHCSGIAHCDADDESQWKQHQLELLLSAD